MARPTATTIMWPLAFPRKYALFSDEKFINPAENGHAKVIFSEASTCFLLFLFSGAGAADQKDQTPIITEV